MTKQAIRTRLSIDLNFEYVTIMVLTLTHLNFKIKFIKEK